MNGMTTIDRHYRRRMSARTIIAVRGMALLLAALLASACSTPAQRTDTVRGTPSPTVAAPGANDVLLRALGLIGTPYRWGGNTPEGGFDCSGLVHFVFRDAAGLNLPRTSQAISEIPAPKIARQTLLPGDLVFFGRGRNVDHVGIYVGEGRFVHAPNAGGTVRIDPMSGPYWRDRFLFARRPLSGF